MQKSFGNFSRGLAWLMAVLLGFMVWASAQTNTTGSTNDTVSVVKVEKESAVRTGPLVDEDSVLTFGLNYIPPLRTALFGQPLWKYVASLVYILLALYSSKLINWVVTVLFKRWAARTETKLDDLLIELVHGPVKVVSFVIFLHIGLRVFAWPPWVEDYLTKGLRLIVAWSITYMILKAVDMAMVYWRNHLDSDDDKMFDDHLFPILRKSVKAFIVLIAVLVTSQNLGLNITSVIASLSIGGLALGLAAQDTVANLFGAVAVFVDKPFRIGDRIKLESVDGVVETIGLRSTRVRSLDGFLVTIPNKTMGNATITNVTRRPTIKTEMNLGVTYDTTQPKMRQAVAILEELYRSHPNTADLVVGFNKFGDSALNIMVVHWWNGSDYKAYVAGMQELNFAVKKRFEDAGIEFAFPTQTLHVKQEGDWKLGGGSHPHAEPGSR